MGQLPQFLEALSPGMDVGRVVENDRATRLIDMEAAHAVAVVRQQVGVRKMAQVVGTLPHLDGVRKACNYLDQARRIALEMNRVVQHDADSTQGVRLKKSGKQFETDFLPGLKGCQVAIENQYIVLCPSQNGIAGLAIFGFAVDLFVGGLQGTILLVGKRHAFAWGRASDHGQAMGGVLVLRRTL